MPAAAESYLEIRKMPTLNDIPMGALVRLKRRDGSTREGIFRGFDGAGLIFEDANGETFHDIGPWVEVTVQLSERWFIVDL